MSVDIILPNLGFDSREARIIEWQKQPGDAIRKGEIIAVIESDKASVELESIADGTVLEHLYPAGEMAPVGAPIARVGIPTETPAPSTSPPTQPIRSSAGSSPAVTPVAQRFADEHRVDLSTVVAANGSKRIMRQDVEAALKRETLLPLPPEASDPVILALPKIRKLARDAGIDLAAVPASGSHGQITAADFQRYQNQQTSPPPPPIQPPQPPASEPREGIVEVPITRMRQTIGKRLQESMQEAPHFYVTGEFDLEMAIARLKALPEPRPRINDLLQYLTVLALQRVPELNATFEDGHLYRHHAINLAIAVALDDGLLTPVIADAGRFSLPGLAAESRALIDRVRGNRLRPQDLSGGTFTISNLGVVKQVDQFTAVINPPQVAILAIGTVRQRPLVVDGGLFIRNTVHLTLSGDHRVLDGATLGRFMAAFQAEIDRFSR